MNLELLESFGQNYPEEFDCLLDPGSLAVTAAFNRRGSLLAVGCNDGRLVIWDFLTRGISKMITAHAHPICCLSWSRNGRKILTASTDNTVCVLDVLSGDCDGRYRFPSPVMRVQYHPRDINRFLVSPLRYAGLLCHIQGTHTLVPIDETDIDLNIVASFDRRGNYIFTGNSKGKVCAYRTSDMELVASFKIGQGATSAIKSVEFARRGDGFLLNSADRIIRVYDSKEVLACGVDGEPEPLQKLQDLVNKTMWKKCVFSGDGEYICAGSARQHALYIWEKSVGNLVKILHGTKGELPLDVAWHPVRPIITSISSGIVSLWAQNQVENWSAFAPDFKELDENVEYEERESEFDAEDEDKMTDVINDNAEDDLEVDVIGNVKIPALLSSDEEEEDPTALYFLPIAPEVEEDDPPWFMQTAEQQARRLQAKEEAAAAQRERHAHRRHEYRERERERERERDRDRDLDSRDDSSSDSKENSPRRKRFRTYDMALENPPTDEVHPMLSNKPHKDKASFRRHGHGHGHLHSHRDRERDRDRDRERERDRDRERNRDRERDRERDRREHREHHREREHKEHHRERERDREQEYREFRERERVKEERRRMKQLEEPSSA